MAEKTPTQRLWQDALTGKISRRDVLIRGAALGLSAPVLAALAQETIRGTLAAEEGSPTATFYDWELNLHPGIYDVGDAQGVTVEVAPTENFGNDRFIAEANDESSTWDMYGGVTPFLEMLQLVETGTIEPWDAYVTDEIKADLYPATLAEGSVDGAWYVWPLLLDICVQASNAGILAKADIDPEVAPATWDEFIANAQKVQESGAAPYGLTFDNRDWRSLIPITHSISTDVYSPDGLFLYNSDAAVEALEIMKRMMEWTSADILAAAGVDNTTLVDQATWAAEQAGYYFKYQNAPLTYSATWPDPTQLRLARLPKTEAGVGGTVFWDTGAVLFKYGNNKPKMVEFIQAIQQDQAIWQNSVQGNPDEGTTPVGQLPVTQSTWANWEASPPEFVTANPWIFSVRDALAEASAIAPSLLSIKQFDVARPIWQKYLSGETADARTAGQEALDAVAAEYEAQTGTAPQL
jgi:multiple sugar transport system substrate-binding protein